MKLVIGGSFQGKKAYAQETFHIEETDMTDGALCERDAVFTARLVLHFHEYIRRFLGDAEFLEALPGRLKDQNPRVILVFNELGSGVVPVDAFDREYRERAGRLCCALAGEAEQVHRVLCGVGTVIKDV